jgi:hypothetical protein
LKISAVVCVSPEDPIAVQLRRQYPDEESLAMFPDREGFWAAQQQIRCASSIIISTCPRLDPAVALRDAVRRWPRARRVWFETSQRSTPGPESFPPTTRLLGSIDDLNSGLAALIAEIDMGFEERLRQVRLGRRFAQHHGLSDRATLLIIAIAMGVPEHEWPDVVGQRDQNSFRRWRSREVYAKIGVSSAADLQVRVWDFVQRMGKST